MSSRFIDTVATLDAALERGDWRGSLLHLVHTVWGLVHDPRAKAAVYGSPEIDAACQRAGEIAHGLLGPLPRSEDTPFDATLDVHLATEIMAGSGGHMHALRDVIHARPQQRHVVLLSNLHDKALDLPDLANGTAARVQIVTAPAGDVGLKAVWLMQALRQLRPTRLTLFNHHHDAAVVAAAQPSLARETIYFHHCDHDMALGVYLPHAVHVDCLATSAEHCAHALGLSNVRYWPLVAHDQGARRSEHAFLQGDGITTCAHGSVVKFFGAGRYGYFETMRERLAKVPGRHLHLGSLPADALAGFRATLTAAGIDDTRFVHVEPVPSLWRWLADSDVDVVLSSFPMPGAKGLVETMGAGLPLVMHASSLTRLHGGLDIAYAGAPAWRTPAELVALLQGLDATTLREQARASRAHYEAWHHPRELAYAVNNARLTAPMPPLAAPGRSRPDTLALHWR